MQNTETELQVEDYSIHNHIRKRMSDLLSGTLSDVPVYQRDELTPLMLASAKNTTAELEALLANGADPHTRSFYSHFTALLIASALGTPKAVETLISAGVNLEAADSRGYTPLMHAIIAKNLETTRLLTKAGASITATTRDGLPLLSIAAASSTPEIISHLISQGANIHVKDTTGETPIIEASRHGTPENIQVLLDAGARLDDADSRGQTPYLAACAHSKLNNIKFLHEAGADITARDKGGRTPLIMCAGYMGTPDAIKHLLTHNENIDTQANDGSTALEAASHHKNLEIINLLLEAGANPNIPADYENSMPLHNACASNTPEVIQALIDAGADIEVQDAESWSPLTKTFFAATDYNLHGKPHWVMPESSNHCANTDVLIAAGANIEALSRDGDSPLSTAVRLTSASCVRALLKAGANPNHVGQGGRTPLISAVWQRTPEIVRILLEAGADPHARDETRTTALELAQELQKTEDEEDTLGMVRLLEKAVAQATP